ncbi:MAG: serine/threonine-protein kinase [Kofleriaceae bacterium]
MESLIGEGGMGVVYATRDENGSPAVLKRMHRTLRNDPALVRSFVDEARMLGQVSHHNVVRVVDHGHDAEGPFLVMSRASGETLSAILDREGSFGPRRAFAIAAQLVAGVAAIHREGILHGDLKSTNVLVDGNDRVTIIDFGLARSIHVGSDSTVPAWSRVIAGTPAYMAPELLVGALPSCATDTYAIGVILYELLTGETVFAGSTNILDAHREEAVTPPSHRASCSLSAQIDGFVLRALAKDPSDRFRTASDMARALDRIVATEWRATTVVLETTPPAPRRSGDQSAAITVALERAGRLIDAQCTERAIDILELATTDADTPDTWRLEMVLAALYLTLGHRERARRFAAAAVTHAQTTGCRHAIARTEALARRLGAPCTRTTPRMARGSGRFSM